MDNIYSKSSVSPASGFSFPTTDTDTNAQISEGAPNKPVFREGFESATKDIANLKIEVRTSKDELPLGYDLEIDDQFLPKTGIQDRFLKYHPIFRGNYSEYESVGLPLSPEQTEIIRKRSEEKSSTFERVVYDSTELSPYYNNSGEPDEKYFDESKYIHPIITEQDRKAGAYAPEGYFKYRDSSTTHGVMRYYSHLKTYYKLKNELDETLIFESRFESGNLKRVIQVGDYEYDIYLNPDYQTGTFTQWYFFRIENTRKGRKYTFNIKNYQKSDSLYNQGMLPLIYSRKEFDKCKRSWQRTGENICYYQDPCKKKGSMLNYAMTFNLFFKHDKDEVYMAHWYPYTYSDLKAFINKKWNARDRVRKTSMCKTLAGNDSDMIIITNFSSEDEEIAERQAVILSARVHPGESNSSFIMEGILDFLVSDKPAAFKLRNLFVFKILPMLNPDGVIIGNYRWSLAGVDLNRQWSSPNPKLHPEIYASVTMIKKTLESRPIFFFWDIHGHSRNKNLFMYGWNVLAGPNRLKERIFPFMFSQREESFSFEECNFNIQKNKETTARVVMGRQEIQYSYTLECSFCGPTSGKYQDCHFTPPILKNMGKEFCLTLLQFYENTQLFKDWYAIILDNYENEQKNGAEKSEEEKKNAATKAGKIKAVKEAINAVSASDNSAANGTSNSSKKKNKNKPKNVLKKSSSTNDKKRSHSEEPKQLKPSKKQKSTVTKDNVKAVKSKKKK